MKMQQTPNLNSVKRIWIVHYIFLEANVFGKINVFFLPRGAIPWYRPGHPSALVGGEAGAVAVDAIAGKKT